MIRPTILVVAVAVLGMAQWACSRPRATGTWEFVETGTGDAFYSANFVDENVGWLNGQTDRAFQPAEEEANKNSPPANKVDPLKANQGFEVLLTTDGGQTWRQLPDQFKYKIRSVFFVDAQQGWALTIDRDILHTTDGGANWALQRKAGTVKLKLFGNRRQPEMDQPEQIDKLHFTDALHGWAWGGGRKDQYTEQPGVFLTTVDGGQNWNEIPYPFEQNVWSAFFLDTVRSWASTADGGFYKTADGGLNWTRSEFKQPESRFDSIFFVDASTGWVAGHSGRLAKTTDGGRTWLKMHLIKDEFKIRDLFFIDRDRGWAVGDAGAILYTPNGGGDWIDVGAPLAADLKDVILIGDRTGWAVGLRGAVLRLRRLEAAD